MLNIVTHGKFVFSLLLFFVENGLLASSLEEKQELTRTSCDLGMLRQVVALGNVKIICVARGSQIAHDNIQYTAPGAVSIVF